MLIINGVAQQQQPGKEVFSGYGFCTAKSDARYRYGQTGICGGEIVYEN